MKKLFLPILIGLFLFCTLSAQDAELQTLFPHKKLQLGAFGGPFVGLTMADGEAAIMTGGTLGMVVNDLYIACNWHQLTRPLFQIPDEFDYEQGSIWLGYRLMKNRILHPVVGIQAGMGVLHTNVLEGTGRDYLFTLTPRVELETNVTSYMRFGAGVNYSVALGVDDAGFSNKDFSSPGVYLSLYFGKF